MAQLNTLRVRFAIWITILIVFILGGFGFFVYVTLSKGLNSEIDDLLRLSASQVLDSIDVSRNIPGFSDSFLQSPENSELKKHGLEIRLLDHKGIPIESSGPDFNLKTGETSIRAAKRGEVTLVTLMEPSLGSAVRVYDLPLKYNDRFVGMLQIAAQLTTVQSTLDRLLKALSVSIPALAILSGFIGYFLAAQALSTIDQISKTARRISDKNLNTRLNLPSSNDEVGRLAATFDQMLDRLARSFQRERQFAADASHELRTPLAAFQAILSTTSARRRTPEEYEQALGDLSEEASHLEKTVENLLYLSRSDAYPSDNMGMVNISTLLDDLCDTFQPLAEEKGLSLNISTPDHLEIKADSDGITRLFFNLIDNAIKYTSQGNVSVIAGEIETTHTMHVDIADTGIGIDPDEQECVFDRFYRTDRSRASDGIGLGLAIAREIARRHGGDIQLTSQVGHGSVFTVILPFDRQS